MALNFPSSPVVGQEYQRWRWNGSAWVPIQTVAVPMLPIAGGNITGNLAVAGTTTLTGTLTALGHSQINTLDVAGAADFADGVTIDGDDAATKPWVEEQIAAGSLWQGTWDCATNVPDLTNANLQNNGFTWAVTLADPTASFAIPATPVIPGLNGLTVYNGDHVIWSDSASAFEVVHGSSLSLQEAKAMFGPRTATVVVGNSVLHTRDSVDYWCDGTNDEVTIQAAINSLPNGGRIVVREGTYTLSGHTAYDTSLFDFTTTTASLTLRRCLHIPGNITFEGMGDSTIFRIDFPYTGVSHTIYTWIGVFHIAGRDNVVKNLKIIGDHDQCFAFHLIGGNENQIINITDERSIFAGQQQNTDNVRTILGFMLVARSLHNTIEGCNVRPLDDQYSTPLLANVLMRLIFGYGASHYNNFTGNTFQMRRGAKAVWSATALFIHAWSGFSWNRFTNNSFFHHSMTDLGPEYFDVHAGTVGVFASQLTNGAYTLFSDNAVDIAFDSVNTNTNEWHNAYGFSVSSATRVKVIDNVVNLIVNTGGDSVYFFTGSNGGGWHQLIGNSVNLSMGTAPGRGHPHRRNAVWWGSGSNDSRYHIHANNHIFLTSYSNSDVVMSDSTPIKSYVAIWRSGTNNYRFHICHGNHIYINAPNFTERRLYMFLTNSGYFPYGLKITNNKIYLAGATANNGNPVMFADYNAGWENINIWDETTFDWASVEAAARRFIGPMNNPWNSADVGVVGFMDIHAI